MQLIILRIKKYEKLCQATLVVKTITSNYKIIQRKIICLFK